MSSRRLARDYASLLRSPPPDFFHPPTPPTTLTSIPLFLLGPTGTPFAPGVFHLTLTIPPNYPSSPPRVNFLTKIFHPNVAPDTGEVCVDTLKREWRTDMTLGDVCGVVRCLLVEPNETSALNAEAGRVLGEEGWGVWEKRVRVWVEVHARCPEELKELAEECRRRSGGEDVTKSIKEGGEVAGNLGRTPGRKVRKPVSPKTAGKVKRDPVMKEEDSGKENEESQLEEGRRRSVSPSKRGREEEEALEADDEATPEPRVQTTPTRATTNRRKSPKMKTGDAPRVAVTRKLVAPGASRKEGAKGVVKRQVKVTGGIKVGLKRF